MKPRTTSRELASLVERTISALENARLPLQMPGSEQLSESRAQLMTQLRTRILPHLRTAELPAVVVFGGSSGAGKSTLFNSLLGEEVSPASVIRPTTRMPLIAVHPSDVVALDGHGLLDMGKLVAVEGAIPGVVLVDAPDLDSVDAANRELSRRLLDAADLWVFVTTAARYGDAQAWQTLSDAHRRGMTTAVVLNRVADRARYTVRKDLTRRMNDVGIGNDPLMLVPDAGPHEGLLEPGQVAEVRTWLEAIASARIGAALVDRTTQAMLPELRRQLLELSDAVEMQASAVEHLRAQAEEAPKKPREKLVSNAKMGRFGQGAPTTAWLSFASSGGALASLAVGEKPGLLVRRYQGSRDAAVTTVFDGVMSAIRAGLDQAVTTTDEAIRQAWDQGMVETAEFQFEAATVLNKREIIDTALSRWKSDVLTMSAGAGDNPWLGHGGVAALLGAAAGGVSGAEQACSHLKVASSIRKARESLATHLDEAVGEVVSAYNGVLDQVPVGNGRQLRLRASEYLDRV
ncbi:GTPase [Ancrocorticia populi]|uniref:GTPase n=2 Tax=Ancrocorticia populi TaxID=2175228 RepID=UPI0023542940|nr:GTPase [Ancrocorticia populi]